MEETFWLDQTEVLGQLLSEGRFAHWARAFLGDVATGSTSDSVGWLVRFTFVV